MFLLSTECSKPRCFENLVPSAWENYILFIQTISMSRTSSVYWLGTGISSWLSLDFLVDYISGYSLSLFLNQEAVEVCASSIQVSVSRFMFIIRREGRRHHFKLFLKKAYDACLKWALLIKMLWNFWTSIHIINWCISLKLLDDWVLVLDHDIV